MTHRCYVLSEKKISCFNLRRKCIVWNPKTSTPRIKATDFLCSVSMEMKMISPRDVDLDGARGQTLCRQRPSVLHFWLTSLCVFFKPRRCALRASPCCERFVPARKSAVGDFQFQNCASAERGRSLISDGRLDWPLCQFSIKEDDWRFNLPWKLSNKMPSTFRWEGERGCYKLKPHVA